MSEITEVTMVKDTGQRFQWARSLFFTKEGQKETLVSKRLIYGVVAIFLLTSIILILQGSPEQRTKSIFSSTTESTSVSSVNFPLVSQNAFTEAPSGNIAKKPGKKRNLRPQLVSRPRLKIPPGYSVKAKLIGGASNGPVQAEVSDAPSINGETIVDEGVFLHGNGASTENRLFITFNKMVFKDGEIQNVRAYARDVEDLMVGLKGSLIGNYALKLGGSVGLSFIGGLSEALQDTDAQGGVAVRRPSLKNAVLNGSATAALEQSREMMSSLKENQPIIEVKNGNDLVISFTE